MNNDNDNSIFFLTISLICIWLIVDYVVGKQYIGKFISMLPFMSGSSTSSTPDTGYGDDEEEFIRRLEEANVPADQIATCKKVLQNRYSNPGCITMAEWQTFLQLVQKYGEGLNIAT